MPVPEVSNILTQSKARALITSQKFISSLQSLTLELGVKLISLEPDAAEGASQSSSDLPLPDPAPSDLAVIIFTSGTTGFSKGVMPLSHQQIMKE